MVSIGEVQQALPQFRNEKRIIKQRQGTEDIIKEVCNTHGRYAGDYDLIYPMFDRGDIYYTSKEIFDFLKNNLRYNAETGKEQSVKSPSAILHDGEHIDCKHYSLFIAGILDAIKQNEGDGFDWCYRFASYDGTNIPGHVFVVVSDQGKEIWIDPVLTNFNQRKKPTFYEDIKPMSLVEISGFKDQTVGAVSPLIDVNKDMAFSSFLTMVGFDMFSLKDLLGQNPDITNGALRTYCEKNGFSFLQLQNFINS